jgi:hypothetical protein
VGGDDQAARRERRTVILGIPIMFVILTSKPGQFHTVVGEGLRPVESWTYLLDGRKRAEFVIAEITGSPRITIVDETPPPVVNEIPSKLLERFATVERARSELASLAGGRPGFRLERVASN